MAFGEILAIVIKGDASGAVNAFERTGASAKKNLTDASDKTARMGASFQRTGAVMLGAAGLAGAGLVKLAQRGSDLNEQVNKTNVVFGKSADEIQKWAKGTADSFGISRVEALKAAGGFGNMLRTVGLAAPKAAEMSQKLVELAADMASFNDTDPSEMLEKLRSGLAGEAEPLRQFGVLLSEAEVKAFAYKTGIAKVGEELTEAEKVQARYGLIMEQTKLQHGDFARTSDSAANAQRRFAAQVDDLQANLGTGLLPALNSILGVGNDVVGMFGSLNTVTEGTAGKVLGISVAALAAGGALTFVAGTALRAQATFTQLSQSSALAATSLKSVGIAAVAVVGFEAIEGVKSLTQSLYANATGSDLAGKGVKLFGDAGLALTGNIQPLIHDTVDFGKSLFGMGNEEDTAAEKTKKLKDALGPAANETNRIAGLLKTAEDATTQFGAQSQQAVTAIAAYREAAGTAADAQDSFAKATQDAATALKELQGIALGAIGAQLSYAQAQQANAEAQQGIFDAQTALNDAIAAHGPASAEAAAAQAAFDEAKAAGSQANFALLESSFALQDQMGELEDQVRNGNTTAVDALIAKLREEMRQHPETAATIAPLIYQLEVLKQKYDAVPPLKHTTVTADTLPARYEIDKFLYQYDGASIRVNVVYSPASGSSDPLKPYGKATGGAFPGAAAGMPFWVGERGPELMLPNFSGRVLSHSDSMNAIRGSNGGGGNVFYITVTNPDPAAVVNKIKQYERRNGKVFSN